MPSVLLVNPDWRELPRPGHFRTHVPYFPLELMYIHGTLRERGVRAILCDLWGQTTTAGQFAELLKEADYIIVTTAPTYIFWRAGICDVSFPKETVAMLRSRAPQAKIIVIGPQGTALPETMFDSHFDFLIRGEPDIVAADLIRCLEDNGDPFSLPGVCVRKEEAWSRAEETASVNDLEVLPPLDFSILASGTYGQTCYEASRGCPYPCTFCFRSGFRKKYRAKSPERIRTELQNCREAGYNWIEMIDEIFGLDPRWLDEFCDIVAPLRLYWGMQTRTECLNPGRIAKLKASGCASIEIGLESADPAVSAAMGKQTNYDDLVVNVRAACKEGIQQVRLFCIFGAPNETHESIRRTSDWFMQFASLSAVQPDVFPMMPFPGTALWDMAQKQGYKLETWEDMQALTGTIANAFSRPDEIEREIAGFYRRWNSARKKAEFRERLRGKLRRALGR